MQCYCHLLAVRWITTEVIFQPFQKQAAHVFQSVQKWNRLCWYVSGKLGEAYLFSECTGKNILDRNVSEGFYFHTRYTGCFSTFSVAVYRNEPCVTLMWCVWRHPCSQARGCFRVYLTLFMIYFKDCFIFQALDSTLVFRGWRVVSHTWNCSSCFGYLIATDSVVISCRPCFPNG